MFLNPWDTQTQQSGYPMAKARELAALAKNSRKRTGGKGTYVGRPGRGVGSGSGKEDKGSFNQKIQYYSQIFGAQAADQEELHPPTRPPRKHTYRI